MTKKYTENFLQETRKKENKFKIELEKNSEATINQHLSFKFLSRIANPHVKKKERKKINHQRIKSIKTKKLTLLLKPRTERNFG